MLFSSPNSKAMFVKSKFDVSSFVICIDMTLDLPHDSFAHLRFLNLNRTLIRTWDDVDILGRFPALRYLRIQGCPLFEVSFLLLSFSFLDHRRWRRSKNPVHKHRHAIGLCFVWQLNTHTVIATLGAMYVI